MALVLIYIRYLFVIIVTLFSCRLNKSGETKKLAALEQRGFKLEPFDLEINGCHVHGAANGDATKKPLVFVHGSPGGWMDYAEYLTDSTLLHHFYVICFDRPGFGGSSPGSTMNIPCQADVLAKAYHQLQPEKKAIWVGHSLGGPLVVFLAMQHAQVVDGLALLAASVSPELEKRESWRFIFDRPFFKWLLPSKLFVSNKEIRMFKTDVHGLTDPWSTLTMPTIIIHGSRDPLVPFANADFAMTRLPASSVKRLVEIPGANHFIPWNHYVVVRDELIHFFNQYK